MRNPMNEQIFLRFENGGRPMTVVSFDPAQGLEFDEPKDASPLNMAIGLQALFPARLHPVRLRHDWRNKEFNLDVRKESGGLLFSGYKGDPEGLPFGPYDISIEVESYQFKNAQKRVVIAQGGRAEVVLSVKPDLRRVSLRDNFDAESERIVQASSIEGAPLAQWLRSDKPRAARQACLLNVLTKLAVRPAPARGFTEPLSRRVETMYFADVDRVYASADPDLTADLESLVRSELWVREGTPKADIHRRLLNTLPQFGISESDAGRFDLQSFRQGGRNCLQIVLAIPRKDFKHPAVYADIDIDLGNPLWDLEGLCVHLGELLDPGRTDHFALHKKLRKGDTSDFIFYDVVAAKAAAA
jgi:hypothetical protein